MGRNFDLDPTLKTHEKADSGPVIETREKGGLCYEFDAKGQLMVSEKYAVESKCIATNVNEEQESQSSMNAQAGSNRSDCSEADRSSLCLQGAGMQYSDEQVHDDTLGDDAFFLPRTGTQFGNKGRLSMPMYETADPILRDPNVPWCLQSDIPLVPEPGIGPLRPRSEGTEAPELVPSLTTDQSTSRDTQSSIADEGLYKEGNEDLPSEFHVPQRSIRGDDQPVDRSQEGSSPKSSYCYPEFGTIPREEENLKPLDKDDNMDVDEEVVQRNRCSESLNETDSGDAESFWMSDYSECTQDLVEKQPLLYSYRSTVLEQLLKDFSNSSRTCVEGSGRTNTNVRGVQEPIDQRAHDQSAGGEGTKKRKRLEEQQDDTKDDSGASLTIGGRKSKPTRRRLLLACPFCKKDPQRHRNCYRKVLTKISYVKQHLSRHHRLPIYCSICTAIFDSEDIRDDHVRSRSCEEQPKVAWEGVSEVQKKELQKRVSSQMSEEDQWYTIFEVLFPDHPRPRSAYIDSDLSEDLCAFRDFAINRGPCIISERLRREGHALDDQSNEQGLSAFHETIIADGIQAIFERWQESEELRTGGNTGRTMDGIVENEGESQDGGSSSKTLVDDPSIEQRLLSGQPLDVEMSEEIPKTGQLSLSVDEHSYYEFTGNHSPNSAQHSQYAPLETEYDGIKALEPCGTRDLVSPNNNTAIDTRSELEEFFEMATYLQGYMPSE